MRAASIAGVSAAALLTVTSVHAQEAGPAESTQLEDLVVTATRRAQNLRDIPIAVSSVDEAALKAANVTSPLQLQGLVPGLQVSRNNAIMVFSIRGIGSLFRGRGADPSVAFHSDGVYLAQGTAYQASFFDVERVEVVRGPQGALYGRNATGGAVNVISRLPTETASGYGEIGVGAYRSLDLEAVVSGPVAGDRLLMRAGAYYHLRDKGFGENFTTGHPVDDKEEYGGRLTVLARPSDALQVILRGDYFKAGDYSLGTGIRPGAAPGRAVACVNVTCAPGRSLAETLGGRIASDPYDSYANVDTRRDTDSWGVSAEATFDLTDQLVLKSLTAYREVSGFNETDNDQTQLSLSDPLRISTAAEQVSQELQLSYRSDRVFLVGGLYYFREEAATDTFIGFQIYSFLPPPNARNYIQVGELTTETYAAFANLDLDLTDHLTLGVGARYTEEDKENVGRSASIFGPVRPVADSSSDNAFTPRFTLNYKLTPDVSLYANISRGFKSGQFLVGTAQRSAPEYLWDYEAGFKGLFLDRRLRASASAFYYDFRNVQLQVFRGVANTLINADGGELYGVEGSVDWQLAGGFLLHVDGLWEKSRLEGLISDDPNSGVLNADLTGNRFPYAPTLSGRIALEKTVDWPNGGRGVFHVEDQYTSGTYLDIFESRANAYRPAFHIVNASYRHSLPDGRTSVLLWANNLTNKTVVNAVNIGAAGLGAQQLVNYSPPRTFGVTLRREF